MDKNVLIGVGVAAAVGIGIAAYYFTRTAAGNGAYSVCGAIPKEGDSETSVCDWWKCAFTLAESRGICSSSWDKWHNEVGTDILKEEGTMPYITPCSYSNEPDGADKVMIKMGCADTLLGSFKWTC